MPRPAEMELPLRAVKLICEGPGVGAGPLAQALEAPPATLRRALDALLAQDFIRKEGEGYVPGPAVPRAWAAYRAIQHQRLAESRAALEETETGEEEIPSASLGIAAAAATQNGKILGSIGSGS